jgi:hypothetical protein
MNDALLLAIAGRCVGDAGKGLFNAIGLPAGKPLVPGTNGGAVIGAGEGTDRPESLTYG